MSLIFLWIQAPQSQHFLLEIFKWCTKGDKVDKLMNEIQDILMPLSPFYNSNRLTNNGQNVCVCCCQSKPLWAYEVSLNWKQHSGCLKGSLWFPIILVELTTLRVFISWTELIIDRERGGGLWRVPHASVAETDAIILPSRVCMCVCAIHTHTNKKGDLTYKISFSGPIHTTALSFKSELKRWCGWRWYLF